MATEKDRLGEKLRDAERAREDEYFAKRDRELIEKLRRERDAELQTEMRTAGDMRCPRCGVALEERDENGVTIDECPSCRGLWLDNGELELLAKREEEGWFGRLFRARHTATR